MEQLKRAFKIFSENFLSFLFFLGSMAALFLYPVVFLVLLLISIVPMLVTLHKVITLHKSKYKALEAERDSVLAELSTQAIDNEDWRKYEPPILVSKEVPRYFPNTLPIALAFKSRPDYAPNVLIIEDDPDVAMATEQVFKQLGCNTTVSDGHDGVSYKMSFQNYDFIVLDWMLGGDLKGDDVVKKSVETIELFNDLRLRFESKHPKIITYSVLSGPQVRLPKNKYFSHLDHWNKPVKYNDLAFKVSKMLTANGYQGVVN